MTTPAGTAAVQLDESVRRAARASDPDRYTAALLAPRHIRADLIVLAAFAGEIARIPGLVREPMMGEIRYQWWRDQLAGLAEDTASGNPLADSLGRVIRRHRLPVGLLIGIVDAAAGDLHRALPADDGELRSRHARGDGAHLELAAIVHGLERTTAIDEACAQGGFALGVARGLSRVGWHLAHGGLPMTVARLAAEGVDLARALPLPDDPALERASGGVCALAAAALDELAAKVSWLPPAALGALLPVAMVRPYLRAQTQGGGEPTPLARAWALWRARRRRRL